MIAGLRGGSGKTLVSLGLLAAWRRQGVNVAPFKKGPDYIDAAWLALAAGRDCRNLDLFLMSRATIRRNFTAAAIADVAVVEGNRGLYDGMDATGSCSTAEIAKLLDIPVVLVVDCTKATRTIAALVLGCQRLDPEVQIRGVILNRTGGTRHETVVRASIERSCGVPVLGAIPRLSDASLFPERHLGLVPPQESKKVTARVAAAADAVEQYVNLDAVLQIARDVRSVEADGGTGPDSEHRGVKATAGQAVRIGVFRDAAFQFYYPENLEALRSAGGELVAISPILETQLPQVDALYIGGGFPETLAIDLSENEAFRTALARQIESGLPVYAECGGAVYLGESLLYQGHEHPMVGALPVSFAFASRPKGHGYTELEAVGDSPFYEAGSQIRGHEFHYTYMQSTSVNDLDFVFRVLKGFGFDGKRDGLRMFNTLACYTHVHASGTVEWAGSLVRAAARFKASSSASTAVSR
jgi:cobyrinic acid a,c-diamide synthase